MMYSTTVAIAVASSLIFHGRGPTRALAASDVGGNSDYEYCVIGAGPAGIQMGLFLEQANRSYVVLERGEGAGTFFKKYPRHRTLISLNKRHTGRGGSALSLEHNLRHDWHSLLTSLQSGEIDERRLFTSWTNKFYPPADKLVEYFQDWADHYALNIQYGTEVLSIRENSGHAGFTLRTQHVNSTDAASPINCKWALAATGLYKGHVPDLTGLAEHSIGYNDISTERSAYTNKSIAIVGAGNAGFETFSDVMEEAAFVHIHSRSSIKFAWETHYVGDVRSINTLPIDNYQLKSQDILHMPSPVGLTKEDTVIEKEVIDGVEKICMNDIRHAEMTKWIDEGATPAGLKGQKTGGHSLTFEQRFTNVDRCVLNVASRPAAVPEPRGPPQVLLRRRNPLHRNGGRRLDLPA
jgi:thioredoxin reductase